MQSFTGCGYFTLMTFDTQEERLIMKMLSVSILFTTVLQAGFVHADTVIEEVPDTAPGFSFGGVSGFMAGAAAGGPVGAAIGAGLGWLVGAEVSRSTDLSGPAYRVLRNDGEETVVRSPGRHWSPGDRVLIVGNRLVADVGAGSIDPVALSHR
jgi:outer membrane lipoprotein SlyB